MEVGVGYRTEMVLEQIPLPELGRGSAQADQEHRWSCKRVPAQEKVEREPRMDREKHKPARNKSTEGQDGDTQG